MKRKNFLKLMVGLVGTVPLYSKTQKQQNTNKQDISEFLNGAELYCFSITRKNFDVKKLVVDFLMKENCIKNYFIIESKSSKFLMLEESDKIHEIKIWDHDNRYGKSYICCDKNEIHTISNNTSLIFYTKEFIGGSDGNEFYFIVRILT